MSTTLTPTERACAWELSDLFLDGTLPDWHRDGIASELARLPYTVDEIEKFLWNDVFPALIWNLVACTGQWGMFDQDEVCDAIEAMRASSTSIFAPLSSWLKMLLFSGAITGVWADIKRRLLENSTAVDASS